jgi:hypothetical protein
MEGTVFGEFQGGRLLPGIKAGNWLGIVIREGATKWTCCMLA